MRSILKADRKTCTQTMRNERNLLTLRNRRRFFRFQRIFKIVHSFLRAEQLISYLPRRCGSVRTRELHEKRQFTTKSQDSHGPKYLSVLGRERLE